MGCPLSSRRQRGVRVVPQFLQATSMGDAAEGVAVVGGVLVLGCSTEIVV